jgi:Biotin carboxylase, N-terminal domain
VIKRLLVANRGEIAVRIMATASVLGVETVAVYPADDAACGHAGTPGLGTPGLGTPGLGTPLGAWRSRSGSTPRRCSRTARSGRVAAR